MTPVGLSWAQWSLIFIPAVICALCAAAAVLGLGFVVQLARNGQLALMPPDRPAAPGTAVAVRAAAVPARARHAAVPPGPPRARAGRLARLRRPAEPGDPSFWGEGHYLPAPPPAPSGGPHDSTVVLTAATTCQGCSGYICPDCRGCECPGRKCQCFGAGA